MREDFLHYLWRFQRFDHHHLLTTQGETIHIVDTGQPNPHAGPDFLQARVRIGGTLWAGNVEMHLRASEWAAHGHGDDRHYDNVILHVVLEEDQPVLRANGERLPCLELQRRVPPGLNKVYWRLLHQADWIPCAPQFDSVPSLTHTLWLERLLVQRLESRTDAIGQRLAANNGDWEETFYQLLATGLGSKVNAEPFELLSRSLPLKLLLRHKAQLLQMEALLFGQAGLLEEEMQDDYPQRLQREYQFLRRKYDLTPIPTAAWKFLRMRPANFPTVRLAQLATSLYQSGHLFSKILAARDLTELENMFEVKLSNYWWTHYRFDKESPRRAKQLGRTTIHLLVINVIAPLLFFYGKHRGDTQYQDRALRLLEETPAEKNHVIEGWRGLGLSPDSAGQSQALLELKHHYCDRRRCLHCAVGHVLLKEA